MLGTEKLLRKVNSCTDLEKQVRKDHLLRIIYKLADRALGKIGPVAALPAPFSFTTAGNQDWFARLNIFPNTC